VEPPGEVSETETGFGAHLLIDNPTPDAVGSSSRPRTGSAIGPSPTPSHSSWSVSASSSAA